MALVVEDNTSMRHLLTLALQRIPGMRTIVAEHGLDALLKMSQTRPDIVLTDLNMPVMDGWTLIEHIRRDPAFAELPIAVISTDDKPTDRARAMTRGADAYLTKPVRAPRVLAETKRLLGL